MTGDLFAGRAIAIAQFTAHVLPRLRQKRQDRLMALFASVLGVVTLASSHLMAETRMHRGVGIQSHFAQFHYERQGCQFIISVRKTSRLVDALRAARWTGSPRTDADGQCEFRYQ